jgi:2-polyprenyl-3-methyl-5-hydroxy-6-metoxy-1,4-benzoquinol methylase
MSNANKFNIWTFDSIKSNCSGKILEIGSGLGNISKSFIDNNYDIYLSDIRLNYREFIIKQFSFPNNKVLNIDIASENFEDEHPDLLSKFDTVFCLNVVEHIKNDRLAVSNMMKLLKKEGKLIVLVPAYQWLYNGFDETLEHYRRYTKKSLSEIMVSEGKLVTSYYFNTIGILGWFVSGAIFKNKKLPKKEVTLYNKLVPIIKMIDKITFRSFGLSVVCVIEK